MSPSKNLNLTDCCNNFFKYEFRVKALSPNVKLTVFYRSECFEKLKILN